MSDLVTAPRADRRRFSLHPEREGVEVTRHRRQIEYLETNLRTQLPDRFVGGNLGVYWVPGQRREPWVGPDVLVSEMKEELRRLVTHSLASPVVALATNTMTSQLPSQSSFQVAPFVAEVTPRLGDPLVFGLDPDSTVAG